MCVVCCHYQWVKTCIKRSKHSLIQLHIYSVKVYENYAHTVWNCKRITHTVWNCMRIMHKQCETVWQYRRKTKNAPHIWSLMLQYLKFTHMHVSVNKVYVTQAVNIHWKARGCDQLYTGQRDKTNYKIIFSLFTSGRHIGGEVLWFHSNLSTGETSRG